MYMMMLMNMVVIMCMVMLMCMVMMTGSYGMFFEVSKAVFDGVADPLNPVGHAGAIL